MKGTQSTFRMLLERIDWPLVTIVMVLAGVGIVNLASASNATGSLALHVTQIIWLLVGLVLVGVVTLLDYRLIERWSYILYAVVLTLLVGVLLVGTEVNGSKRWLDLGVFMMQPSELLKLGVIIVTARYFHGRDQSEPYGLLQLARPAGVVAAGVLLVVVQPDLGTSLVIIAIFMTMVLFEGVQLQSLLGLALAAVVALPFAWTMGMQDYQKDRVIAFLNLDEDKQGQSWQVRQSMIAFGSGQVWGKGHVEGTQIQKGFVPEHENDFIAANWAEEHGFMGMLFLLGVYMALLGWALRISSRARDRFGVHLSVGVAALIFWHVVINLAMVTGMLPVVGLTLPLLSYGGSNLLTTMIAIGLLLNVSLRRKPLVA